MPSILPPLAFDLLAAPALLPWLAAAAVPLVIHLLSRLRYREMSWAAMEYLLAAMKTSRRRLRVEQWLLLLVRTLVVVLVVLAVARSCIQEAGLAFVPGQRTHRVLVIDGSYSMGYKPTDTTRFDRAKELAARIVKESPQGDGFTLVLMSAPPRVVVGTPAFEPRDMLQEIDGLKLPHTTADLPATLAKVEQVLLGARREHPRLVREEVHFLTDLGRVGWEPGPVDAAVTEEFRQRAKRLAESAALVIIDLGQAGAENVAVSDLRTGEPFAALGRNVHIEAKLQNFGRQARSGQPVELLVDGRRVKQEQVDVAAGGSASVGFSYRFDTSGDHVLEVRTEGDQLDVDNHRWIALPVKQSINVLCIDGRPSGEAVGGAAGYLAYALAPADTAGRPAMVRPEVKPESALLELDLARYDCLFLCNVAQFTSSEARVMEAYLKSGGSLVFFLGEQVLADRYNHELTGGTAGGIHLLPARLGPVVDQPSYRLDPLGYRHPIVRAFRGRERAGLLTTPVDTHFKLIVPSGSKAKVALALPGGDPLVVEEPIHRGRVVLVATSADKSWTPMPVWPSYVPLVQELLAYAIGNQLQQRNLRVGQTLGASVSTPASDAPLTIDCPDGRSEAVRLRTDGDYSAWDYSDTGTSGIYIARFGPPISQSDAFAVNVDPAEGDLAQLSPDRLRDEIWPGVPFVHCTSWDSLDEQPVARISRRGGLPKMLLYAVLGLLFVETFMAWRFGHHTQ